MPNKDGTGPLGQGPGGGRLRGGCRLIDRGSNENSEPNRQGRNCAGGNAGSAGRGRGRGLNSSNNMKNK